MSPWEKDLNSTNYGDKNLKGMMWGHLKRFLGIGITLRGH